MTQEQNMIKLKEFIEKADQMKKQEKMDLSSDQDLSFAVMNLISIEEHLIFSGAKTGKKAYYHWVEDVRELRKELLKKIVKDPEGEVWCISKHLLAATMRLMEVGTKQQSAGRMDEAYEFFDRAYQIYSLFWGLNLGVLNTNQVKAINPELAAISEEVRTARKTQHIHKNMLGKLGELVKKAIDCCLE
ncbi:MAG: hypothetical protein A2298_03210 [Gammaproteobacteria bacterium RIFOXYB2_FULL_38_6]|nr:MAG: hypothetical protein A2298_03210 [Gammaproteobacteria bacterium RIFOXYB2_FULL_38_6]